MDAEFTARNVAKWIAKSIVAIKTTELVANVAADYTRFEKDDMVVKIGAGVVGWGVSSKLEPVTDRFVDTTADFIASYRGKLNTKKNAKPQEK